MSRARYLTQTFNVEDVRITMRGKREPTDLGESFAKQYRRPGEFPHLEYVAACDTCGAAYVDVGRCEYRGCNLYLMMKMRCCTVVWWEMGAKRQTERYCSGLVRPLARGDQHDYVIAAFRIGGPTAVDDIILPQDALQLQDEEPLLGYQRVIT